MEFWPLWNQKNWEMLVSLPRCKGAWASEHWKRGYRWHGYVKKNLFQHLVAAVKCCKIRPDDDDRGRNVLFNAEIIRILEFIRKLELWQLFTQAWRVWNRSCDYINLQTHWHILRCDIQRDSALWTKHINTKHKRGPVMSCFRTKKKVKRSKESWAAPSMKETRAGSLSASFQTMPPYSQKEPFQWVRRRRSGKSFILIHGMEEIWHFRFPKRSRQCHVISIKRNDKTAWWFKTLGFNQISTRDFSHEAWLHKIFEGSTKKRIEIMFFLRACEGHSGGIPNEPELMDHVFIPRCWNMYIIHRGFSWNFQSMMGNGLIPWGKEKNKARQAVFLTPTNSFGNDLVEEEPHDDGWHSSTESTLRNLLETRLAKCGYDSWRLYIGKLQGRHQR